MRQHTSRHTRTAALLLTLLALAATTLFAGSAPAEASVFRCDGKVVTVDLNLGQSPTNGNDVIRGTNGSDTISAGGGHDIVCAGGGRDWVYGQGGNDRLFGNTGRDVLVGGDGNDVLSGQKSDDTLRGGNGNDKIWGGDGNDTLEGGNGTDTLYGGFGNDTLTGDAGTDAANGGPGTDSCNAESYNSCETVPQPPRWVSSVELTLTSISQFDFGISWGATTGGAPKTFEIRLVNSAGATSNAEIVDARTTADFLVGSFNTFALDPDDIYEVQVIAVNDAGASAPILLGPVTTLKRETYAQIGDQSVDAAALPSGALSSAGGFDGWVTIDGERTLEGGGDCPFDPQLIKSGEGWKFAWTTMFRHEATTKICHDGSSFTLNDTVQHVCEKWRHADTGIVQTTTDPGTNSLTNYFFCVWDADVKAGIEATLTNGKVSSGINASTAYSADGGHTLQHIAQILNGDTKYKTDRWDGAQVPQ